MSAPEPAARPSFPLIRKIDELWALGERIAAAAMFLLMGLLVFAQVVIKVFGRHDTILRLMIDAGILFVVVLLAVRTRAVKEGEKRLDWPMSLGIAAAVTAGIAGVTWGYLEMVPTGLLWAQKIAMVLLIWVAMLGASIATYDRSHLSLEMGEKLWPKKALRWVKAFAHAVTSACCLGFLLVGIEEVSLQRTLGKDIAEAVTAADPIPIIGSLPTWVAFLIVPYTFGMMTVRYLAQMVTTATGTDAPMEERLPS